MMIISVIDLPPAPLANPQGRAWHFEVPPAGVSGGHAGRQAPGRANIERKHQRCPPDTFGAVARGLGLRPPANCRPGQYFQGWPAPRVSHGDVLGGQSGVKSSAVAEALEPSRHVQLAARLFGAASRVGGGHGSWARPLVLGSSRRRMGGGTCACRHAARMARRMGRLKAVTSSAPS